MKRWALAAMMVMACSERSFEPPPPSPTPPTRPPARPSAVVAGSRAFFVMKAVRLGLTVDGATDATAWKYYGLNLDERVTTKEDSQTSLNSCKRLSGTAPSALADGYEGIDNNFGQHTLSVLKSVDGSVESKANAEIESGGYTLILRIDGVGADDNARAPGALYAVGPHAGKPTFQPDDRWPVWSSTLSDGVSLDQPIRQFPYGYISDGTWVSGDVIGQPDRMWLPMFGTIEVRASVLLTVDLASGKGTLAGAIPKAQLESMVIPFMSRFGICEGTTMGDQVLNTTTSALDLVIGAPQLQNTDRECDAMSVGLGFDVVPVSAPTQVVPTPPPPKGCKG